MFLNKKRINEAIEELTKRQKKIERLMKKTTFNPRNYLAHAAEKHSICFTIKKLNEFKKGNIPIDDFINKMKSKMEESESDANKEMNLLLEEPTELVDVLIATGSNLKVAAYIHAIREFELLKGAY